MPYPQTSVPARLAAPLDSAAAGPYTPGALADLIEQRLLAINERVAERARPVAVMGQLLEIPQPQRNGVIYDALLVDPGAPAELVRLEVRASTLERLGVREGDIVTAHGPIVGHFFRGRLTLRLRADRVSLAEPPEARERRAVELPVLELVRRAGGTRRPFPATWSPSIALLRSGASLVREDFLAALGPLRDELRVRDVVVSMTSPQELAAAIGGVREEVLVLIRGGGDEAEFAVFEAPPVIEALGACRAYRLLGLGHSRNRTLADCVADWAASVPAEAGRHLAERVEATRQRQQARPVAGTSPGPGLVWAAMLLAALAALVFLLLRLLA